LANGSLRLRPRFHYEGLTLAINNLLPFAGGVGANVEDQAAYSADIERVAGNQPGIARSALVNKALLQSTKVSTAVGSFMAAFQPSDVSDSTTDADFLAQLKQAVITGSVPVAVASGTPDAISAVYPVPPAALVQGVPFYVLAAAANTTTTPTFTPNVGVIPAKLIVKGANIPLAPGDISGAGMWLCLQYNEASDVWVLANPASSITSSGIVTFPSSGSFTVPRGVSRIYVSGCAGGGGGGGSFQGAVVAFSCCSGGGGGGSGYCTTNQAITVIPGETLTVTIGAFGVPGAINGTGSSGGATVITSPTSGILLNLAGGAGGSPGMYTGGAVTGGSGGEGWQRGQSAENQIFQPTNPNIYGKGGGGMSGWGGGGLYGVGGWGRTSVDSVPALQGWQASGFGAGGGGASGAFVIGETYYTGAVGGAGTSGVLFLSF
jgi:hypothetical protein